MINRENYLLVKNYLTYLVGDHLLSTSSVERYKFYLHHWLRWLDDRHLKQWDSITPAFPAYISQITKGQDGSSLSHSTQKKILQRVILFLTWVKNNQGKGFSGLRIPDFSTATRRITPKQVSENVFVTLEEVIAISRINPDDEWSTIRDKAAAVFLFLSGMRVTAFATLPIIAINLDTLTVNQWSDLGVRTKNSKSATTFLFQIPELLDVVRTWDGYIRSVSSSDQPWFAPMCHTWEGTDIVKSSNSDYHSQHINKRLKKLFDQSGVQYRSAHKFRHGHAHHGLLMAKNMSEYKAVSMNLMHSSIETTDSIYAPLSQDEARKIYRTIHSPSPESIPKELLKQQLLELVSSL